MFDKHFILVIFENKIQFIYLSNFKKKKKKHLFLKLFYINKFTLLTILL